MQPKLSETRMIQQSSEPSTVKLLAKSLIPGAALKTSNPFTNKLNRDISCRLLSFQAWQQTDAVRHCETPGTFSLWTFSLWTFSLRTLSLRWLLGPVKIPTRNTKTRSNTYPGAMSHETVTKSNKYKQVIL